MIYTVVFGTKVVFETNNMKQAFEYKNKYLPRFEEAIIYKSGVEIWRGIKAL